MGKQGSCFIVWAWLLGQFWYWKLKHIESEYGPAHPYNAPSLAEGPAASLGYFIFDKLYNFSFDNLSNFIEEPHKEPDTSGSLGLIITYYIFGLILKEIR